MGCPPCCNPNERNWALKWSSQKIQESRSIVSFGSDFRASNGWRCHNWAYRASGALKVRCFRAFLGGARARCSSVAARTAVTGVHRASFNGRITAKTRVEEVTDTKPPLPVSRDDRCTPNSARDMYPPTRAKKVIHDGRPGIEPAASVPQAKPKEKAHRSRLTRELKSPTASPST